MHVGLARAVQPRWTWSRWAAYVLPVMLRGVRDAAHVLMRSAPGPARPRGRPADSALTGQDVASGSRCQRIGALHRDVIGEYGFANVRLGAQSLQDGHKAQPTTRGEFP